MGGDRADGFELDSTRIQFQLHHSEAVCPWAIYLTSLSTRFSMCYVKGYCEE